MIARVTVSPRAGHPDVRGPAAARQAQSLGLQGLDSVNVEDLYFLGGAALTAQDAEAIAARLLVDPVVQSFTVEVVGDGAEAAEDVPGGILVEITPLPGVTDSVAESLLGAAHSLGFTTLERAASGQRVTLSGTLSAETAGRLAAGVLANEVVQRFALNRRLPAPFVGETKAEGLVEVVPVRDLDDAGLLAVNKARRLALDLRELQVVAAHYRAIGREPTDLELEMIAQTWSEHCVHKTFKALIQHQEGDGPVETIDSMYKTYIKGATQQCPKPWLRSVFVDNAGIVDFDGRFELSFKVETHNHPSALEPFGGANTGVGGVVRDVMGVSARPIATTDVLCFGPPDLAFEALPQNVLHPQRVADGVIAGVADYGNKMGIPTVSGAVLYDAGYTSNPLVFCGCVGIAPAGTHRSRAQVGDLIVCLGGRTGRDGLRGATFSSMEMDTSTALIAGSSVQIGHPIHEKQALEALLIARDEGLYNAVTDCGAGGLSSAVGEMATDLGARVQLLDVPLKYSGLNPWEIWLSEAQERMVLAVPPAHWARLSQICEDVGVEVVALGSFTDDATLRVFYGERVVGELDLNLLHDGVPQRQLTSRWTAPTPEAPPDLARLKLDEALLKILSHPTHRSHEDVVRRYDHEVLGGSVLRPYVGVKNDGPSDATVLRPMDAERAAPADAPPKGVALSLGINPQYGRLDPYRMAWAAIDEAVRNLVCVGADPDEIALLDNFCWGNPTLPGRLGGLVRCVKGCYDAAVAYGAPFISGKDSLNNEYADEHGVRHPIPGTLLISAMGFVPDVNQTVSMDLKAPGGLLYLLGSTRAELGGSALYAQLGALGATVPAPLTDPLPRYRALHQAIRAGLVRSAHDCAEGGLAVALAEMCIGGRLGAAVTLGALPRGHHLNDTATLCFSESLGRVIIEVDPTKAEAFEALFEGLPEGQAPAQIGVVTTATNLVITHPQGGAAITLAVSALERAFRGHVEG
jgi:phosphoribosylformylglycinamidine synthase II